VPVFPFTVLRFLTACHQHVKSTYQYYRTTTDFSSAMLWLYVVGLWQVVGRLGGSTDDGSTTCTEFQRAKVANTRQHIGVDYGEGFERRHQEMEHPPGIPQGL